MQGVFVTGLGILSTLGDNVSSNTKSLKEGKCGITNIELFATRYSGILPAGEIKIENKLLREKLKVSVPGVTRTMLLANHAFEEAVHDSNLSEKEISSFDTALIVANTVGGMCQTDELYHDAHSTTVGTEYVNSFDCASVTIYLQEKYGMCGITNTINTACSSSANAIMYGARLIKNGYAKRAIIGGVDSLSKFTVNGFNSLHILSSELCKPFDKNRNGLNLGEGSAFLILEGEETAKGKKIYAEIKGYGNSNDAYHASSLSENGDGPYLAMNEALHVAGLKNEEIDYINTHGTGTENNDEVESRAMIRLFGKTPPFSSTKSNIGHTLGAAGAIEGLYCILNLLNQEIYPELNFKDPIIETGLIPVLNYEKKILKNVMSNSFGFGGNCTSVIFSKY